MIKPRILSYASTNTLICYVCKHQDVKVKLHPPPILTLGYFMECQPKSRHKTVTENFELTVFSRQVFYVELSLALPSVIISVTRC
jgi:hypothetical protein